MASARRRDAAGGQKMPTTTAPRKRKVAQTAMKFSGLMKIMGWPPSASHDAYQRANAAIRTENV
jgi:hypothetical protein